jgi:putative aminopeptidase FrvX
VKEFFAPAPGDVGDQLQTDTNAIFWTRDGIASALISLPNRNMHSPVEIVNLKDLELIPQLMAAFVQSLKSGEQFKVKI